MFRFNLRDELWRIVGTMKRLTPTQLIPWVLAGVAVVVAFQFILCCGGSTIGFFIQRPNVLDVLAQGKREEQIQLLYKQEVFTRIQPFNEVIWVGAGPAFDGLTLQAKRDAARVVYDRFVFTSKYSDVESKVKPLEIRDFNGNRIAVYDRKGLTLTKP